MDTDSVRPVTAPEQKEDDTPTRDKLLIDIWKHAVDTQKHFNEMCAKSRQLGLSFVAASLGTAIFLFTRTNTASNYAFSGTIGGREVVFHVAVFIILAAVAAVYAIKKLDLGVYHQMLRGAVAFNEDLEEQHLRRIIGLEKGLTQAVSHFSRTNNASAGPDAIGKYRYSGDKRRSAGDKLGYFYNVIMGFLLISAGLMFLASNLLKVVK